MDKQLIIHVQILFPTLSKRFLVMWRCRLDCFILGYGRRRTLLSSPPRGDRFVEPPMLGNEQFSVCVKKILFD